MLQSLIRTLLYSGVTRQEYERVRPKIDGQNRTMLSIFSGVTMLMLLITFALSFLFPNIASNRVIYGAGALATGSLFAVARYFSQRKPWVVTALVHTTFAVFFLFGIITGTILEPESRTVAFMVMLVSMPVVFCERPVRMAATLLVYVAVFLLLCARIKDGDVRTIDIMNAVLYGFIGAVGGTVITSIKVKRYVLELQLQDASRLDQLTGMNNRNCFEMELPGYPDRCENTLSCVYMDVNGLHSVNNTQGHESGDRMLRFLAVRMKELFGAEHCYRVGGDEFIVFVPDISPEELSGRINELESSARQQKYFIAIGTSCETRRELDMSRLIKTAESGMYEEKFRYYCEEDGSARRTGG